MDMTGNTVMFGLQNFLNDQHKIYRGASYLGSVPGSVAFYTTNFASAFSQDGATFYMYNQDLGKLYIYDLNNSNGAGGFNQSASSPVTIANPVSGALALQMALTPFGQTIFIAGNEGIVVQPLP